MTRKFELWDSEEKNVVQVRAKKVGKEWMTKCPKHNDQKASLCINEEKQVYFCHGCGWKGKLYQPHQERKRLTQPKKESPPDIPEAQITGYVKGLEYRQKIYLKEARGLADKVIEKYKLGYHKKKKRFTIPIFEDKKCVNVRLYDPLNKDFKILPISKGRGVQLYPQDQLKNGEVLLCEGEWDALCAVSHGIPAITSTAGVQTWRVEWSHKFRGKMINICFDCQDVSRKAAERRAEQLLPFASKVRIIDLRLKDKEDITNWFVKYGRTAEDLLNLIKSTPEYEKLTLKQKRAKEKAIKLASASFTDKSLLEEKPPANKYWIGNGVLPRGGFVLLGGGPKQGKTIVYIQFAKHLSSGRKIFDRFPVPEKAKVLYIFNKSENSKADLYEILEKQTEKFEFKLEDSLPIIFEGLSGMFINQEDNRLTMSYLLKIHDPDVIFLDPLALFYTLDINKLENITKFSAFLAEITHKEEASWFLIHHTRKPGKDEHRSNDDSEFIHELIGSTGLVAYAQTIMILERNLSRPRPYKIFKCLTRHATPPSPIHLYFDEERLTMDLLSKADLAKGGTTVEDVLSVLKELGGEASYTPLTSEARDRLGVTKQRILELLKDAQEQGLVKKKGGKYGKWTLIEKKVMQ